MVSQASVGVHCTAMLAGQVGLRMIGVRLIGERGCHQHGGVVSVRSRPQQLLLVRCLLITDEAVAFAV